MIRKLMRLWLGVLCTLVFSRAFSQDQSCPVNINFLQGNLTHWEAYIGNNKNGNGPGAIKTVYDSTRPAPTGTIGVNIISEYNLPAVPGIQVITSPKYDFFGGFPTIPTINGYQYNYSILLGSTSITRSNSGGTGGGYIRGVSYKINVPATPATQPYTMTYAYALVLENGAHNSVNQPLFSATLNTADSIITCASPKYDLPTLNDANPNGGGATLDTLVAEANGFSVSQQPSPNPNPNSNQTNAPHLQDVWTKGWTEVTFDLSPYRGQQVTLTFEADNCVPGGHFAYAYIALRNTCAGLIISGDSVACINSITKYSIPALAGATYQWVVPGDWTVNSGSNSNIINVTVGQQTGFIIAKEQNSCANLADTLAVKTNPPTVPGNVTSDAEVCAGNNATPLVLGGNTGNVINWIYSTDGINWSSISDQTKSYTAQNLNATTFFKALVQNGASCALDSSTAATIIVDPKSIGGTINPADTNYCTGQVINTLFGLKGNTGNVINWQLSQDSTNWADVNPPNTDTFYNVISLNASTHYRTIVKSGVCPADTSAVASIYLYAAPYPLASINPADTTICDGTTAPLNALVSIGSSYTWINTEPLHNTGNGSIQSVPSFVNAVAAPSKNTDYILNIQNSGCPNTLADTFHVEVVPPITVNPGHDTSVVVNEPLQFNATSNDTSEDIFLWSPPTYLNNPNISGPIAIFDSGLDSITYLVKATDAFGCYGTASVTVKIFKTLPDIFVPTGFTPGKPTNNIFRPIPVGVSSLQFFRVYNRWGQLVFSTSQIGKGWNGTLGGKPQDAGTFVWMVEGTDYTGKTIAKNGTMVLIR
jgi:PKD domain-containing protein/CHU domain-containing protein